MVGRQIFDLVREASGGEVVVGTAYPAILTQMPNHQNSDGTFFHDRLFNDVVVERDGWWIEQRTMVIRTGPRVAEVVYFAAETDQPERKLLGFLLGVLFIDGANTPLEDANRTFEITWDDTIDRFVPVIRANGWMITVLKGDSLLSFDLIDEEKKAASVKPDTFIELLSGQLTWQDRLYHWSKEQQARKQNAA